MSKYRKLSAGFVIIELILLLVLNLYTAKNLNPGENGTYKVDINRFARQLEQGKEIDEIDITQYETIISVQQFDTKENYKYDYAVKDINGKLYCFEYKRDNAKNIIVVTNVFMGIIILATVILLVLLDKKMMTPFNKMNALTTELAKGNLSVPIKQEKSKYFGRFLWGMDMLREKLEGDKVRELELIKEKKTLILSLSHDIKTPLSTIDLYTKALKRNLYESEDERNAAIEGIEKNIADIKRYVGEITAASREDFLALEVNNTEVYLSEIIKRIKIYYEEKMARNYIDFNIKKVENCLLYGDADRLVEVLQNTIENAIKYGDGKQIDICFDEEENCKLITVSNTGCTLPKEELPHVFDSFYRGSNSEKEKGSGLGLYICKELMHKMDGEIFATVKDEKFNITLVIRKL